MIMAKPNLVACPKCNLIHTYCRIMSINDIWSEHFSDGYISLFDVGTTKVCMGCHFLIYNCNELESLRVVENQYDNFNSVVEHPSLAWPKLQDWMIAYRAESLDMQLKAFYGEQAMWMYNQLAHKANEFAESELVELEFYSVEFNGIGDYFIEKANYNDEIHVQLLALDIQRRRGEFKKALSILERISSVQASTRVRYMRKWIIAGSTKLEIYPSYYDRN